MTFQEEGRVTDGTTESIGWLVDTVRTIDGAAPSGEQLVIWPTQSETSPDAGGPLVVFLDPHGPATLYDGKALPGYDVVRAGGVLVVAEDGGMRRLCRDTMSEAVSASSLGF